MKFPIPSPLRAFDHFLLLHAPNLRITRIHFVLFYSSLAILAAGASAFAIPIEWREYGDGNYYFIRRTYEMYFFFATIATLLATFYWMYLTLRDRKQHPFQGGARLCFVFFTYILAIVSINAAPFIMSAVYFALVSAQRNHRQLTLHDDPVLGMAFMIAVTLAAVLNAGRSMAIRPLLITTVVVIALFCGASFLAESLVYGQNFRGGAKFVWLAWLGVYAVSLIAVFAIRSRRRATSLSRSALVFMLVASPSIGMVGLMLASERSALGYFSESWLWYLSLFGFLLTGVLALVFEKGLTRLRALPE